MSFRLLLLSIAPCLSCCVSLPLTHSLNSITKFISKLPVSHSLRLCFSLSSLSLLSLSISFSILSLSTSIPSLYIALSLFCLFFSFSSLSLSISLSLSLCLCCLSPSTATDILYFALQCREAAHFTSQRNVLQEAERGGNGERGGEMGRDGERWREMGRGE